LELHSILIVHDHQLLAVRRLQGFPAKLKHGAFTYLVGARGARGQLECLAVKRVFNGC
jgi:hypothetical protein